MSFHRVVSHRSKDVHRLFLMPPQSSSSVPRFHQISLYTLLLLFALCSHIVHHLTVVSAGLQVLIRKMIERIGSFSGICQMLFKNSSSFRNQINPPMVTPCCPRRTVAVHLFFDFIGDLIDGRGFQILRKYVGTHGPDCHCRRRTQMVTRRNAATVIFMVEGLRAYTPA